jgi:hypothetical protein
MHLRISNGAARPALATVLRCGLALASVATALGLSLILVHYHLRGLFGAFCSAAIAMSLWYVRTGPGLLAVFLSCLAFSSLRFPTTEVRGYGWQSSVVICAVFSVFEGWFGASRRRAEVKT